LLRFDFKLAPGDQSIFLYTLPFVMVVKLVTFYAFGLLRGWWRYVGLSDAFDIAKANLASAGMLYVLFSLILHVRGFPRSVLIVDCLLAVLLVAGARVAVRAYTEMTRKSHSERRTLIVGAGGAGSRIVRELKRNPQLNLTPVGFVDDDTSKQHIRIQGIRVLGPVATLPALVRDLDVHCVLIAIPSCNGSLVQTVVTSCQSCRVDFKILPPLKDHIDGRRAGPITTVRDVQLDDLLGREPVRIDVDTVRSKLQGKVVLITGSSRGIGAEMIKAFGTRGAQCAVNYVADAQGQNKADALGVAKELNDPLVIECDVTQPQQVEAMMKQIQDQRGGLDILVNNSGIIRDRTIKKMSLDEFESIIRVNLVGTFTVTQKAAAILRSGGRVINMSSVSGQMGLFGQANYSSSKAGIIALTKVSARELARQNITVNAIAPGFIDVGMSKGMPDEVTQNFIKQIPLGRLGEAHEIVDAALFLASPMASYITGQVLNVNGGFYLG